jgi:putative transposase
MLLQSDRHCELLVEVLSEYRIASNHVHLLITVPSEFPVERAVQFIKGGFSFRMHKELGVKPPVWQRGFSEVRILHGRSFENHRTYIHQNPVEAGLASRPRSFVSAPHFQAMTSMEPRFTSGAKALAIGKSFGTAEAVPCYGG